VKLKHLVLVLLVVPALMGAPKKPKTTPPQTSPLDDYIREAMKHAQSNSLDAKGSLWRPGSAYENIGGDLRAGNVDDIVTILVSESASALASGDVKTSRQSTAQSAVNAVGGLTRATGRLANLANTNTQTSLQGTGTTSRQSVINTTMSARITQVLPNGFLVIEGDKTVQVNSENEVVKVRGVIRPVDLQTGNVIQSNQIGQLEVRVNGKGVVQDAIRRPFFLYRLLLGILPF
jgi:flagellar L-ring protein precursor FlgH